MLDFYARWIDQWENKLATRDKNRVVRPFEWGFDWLGLTPKNGNPHRELRDFIRDAVEDSDRFFSYEPVKDAKLEGSHLTFSSPIRSPFPENNIVHGEYFPAPKANGRAVLVLPQWNSDAQGHIGLCKLLNRFGISALRMSMAYHDRRMPPELERADYHVSSNIGRTIHASRQSVIDCRACFDWLQSRGYNRLGILGTSLGFCVAFITTAHDERIKTGVFNHVSTYFSDVVWTGLSTQHVRKGFGTEVDQDQLREYWSVISPATYLDRLVGRKLDSLLIWARYDTTFLPVFSKQVFDEFRRRNLPFQRFTLPCAHYTTGRFPFNLMDGLTMCRFLSRKM